MPGMKDTVRERLLGMVREVHPESGWKVMVVDKVCCKILSASISLSSIMDEGVTLIENLEVQPRQPMPDMDAIYFIRPTTTSIQHMLKDFEGTRRTYGAIHLYFSSHLEDSGLQMIRENRTVVSRIKTLKELNLEFRPYESQAFLLDTETDSFFNLYSPNAGGKCQQEHTQLANKLLTLCVTLNEFPVIRYSKTKNAEQIANKLQDKLDQFRRIPGTDWRPSEGSQATLVILDRSVDPLAPLIHEHTYQAMIMDLMEIQNDVYQHSIQTGGGKEQRKDMLLNESDPIWSKLRHLFIADASNTVSEEFKEFLSKNKAAGFAKKSGGSDLSAMSEALREMPQYRDLIEKYSLHMALAKACMDLHTQNGIETVATQEQDMAMGEDAEGKSPQPLGPLTQILRDPAIPSIIKLRLLMIYIITQEGLREQDRKKLMQTAGLTEQDEGVVQALEQMGVSLVKPQKKFGGLKLGLGGGKEKRRKADEVNYDLFRFRPSLYFLAQDLLDEKVSRDEYPCVRDPIRPTTEAARGGGTAAAASARTRSAGWAVRNKEKKGEEERKFSGPRIIICCLGGVTFSEMRSAYELTKASNREIIIGSTNTLLAKNYIEKLKNLSSLS